MYCKLSIVVPVYNVEDYVGQTLKSIFATDATGFEVVVVNDGTKDRSMDVVRQFADRPNLTIIEQENQGLSAARMKGVSAAKGEYVWFVDSDDYLVEKGVDAVLRLLAEKPEAEVLMFPLWWMYETESRSRLDYVIDGDEMVLGKSVIKDLGLPVWASQRFVFKRSLAENPWVFFPVGLIHQDEYFGPVLVYLSKRVYVIKEPVYYYRIRPGSTITSHSARSPYDMVSVCKLLFRFINQQVEPDDQTWFNAYCFRRLHSAYAVVGLQSVSPVFCRFARSNGCYVWRQWLKVHPGATLKKKWGRLFYYMYPGIWQRLFARWHMRERA